MALCTNLLLACRGREATPRLEATRQLATNPSRMVAYHVGVSVHFSRRQGSVDAEVLGLKSLGATSLRDDVTWARVESTPGAFSIPADWDDYIQRARDEGTEPLLILGYGNALYDGGDKPTSDEAIDAFARYAAFVVEHFRGRVRMYEIWNEWQLGIGHTTPGTPEGYARLLRRTVAAVRRVDPDAILIAGSVPSQGLPPSGIPKFLRSAIPSWLERMVQAGGLKGIDGVSIHPYVFSERDKSPEKVLHWVTQIEEELREANDGSPVDIYLTEIGWPTHTGKTGTPPEVAAAYAARLLFGARTLPYVRGVWWYDYSDDGTDPHEREHHFGLLTYDGREKPAAAAFSTSAALTTQATNTRRIDVGDPACWVAQFQLGARSVTAVWSSDGAPKRLRFKAAVIPVVRRYDRVLGSACVSASSGGFSCELDVLDVPLTIEGPLDGLVVES